MNIPTLPYSNTPLETLLSPKYKIVKLIGEGGYGNVYKCKSVDGEEVAVKVIDHRRSSSTMEENSGLKCLLEPLLMKSIKHPCLMSAREILSFPSCTCIVMDVASSDICSYIYNNRKTIEWSQLLHWIFQLCQGLACLHVNNIVHGDVKSPNILLVKDQIRLSDFTLSLLLPPSKNPKHTVCTFTHRAPEIFLQKEWSLEVDLWALGCTIYEMIYGSVLFPYQAQTKTTKKIVENDLTPKALNCLKQWATMTEQSFPSTVSKRTNFIPPTCLFVNDSKHALINDLILSLTRVHPQERITMPSVLRHQVFRELHNYFIYPYIKPKLKTFEREAHCEDVEPHVLDYAKKVYSCLPEVAQNKDLFSACLLISAKCHRESIQKLGLNLQKIIPVEQTVCKMLNYQIPI